MSLKSYASLCFQSQLGSIGADDPVWVRHLKERFQSQLGSIGARGGNRSPIRRGGFQSQLGSIGASVPQ